MKLKLLNTHINFNNVDFMQPNCDYTPLGYRQQVKVYFNGREKSVNFNLGEEFPTAEEALQEAVKTIDTLMLQMEMA